MKKVEYSILLFLILAITNCDNRRIVITKDYIINDFWMEKRNNNSILIKKMILKDSALSIFSKEFEDKHDNLDIINKLEIDSSFIYGYNGGNENKPYSSESPSPSLKNKVYFDKDNGWVWFFKNYKGDVRYRIGKLQNDTWYKFSGLINKPIDYYVYIDSLGKSHIYSVGGHTNF